MPKECSSRSRASSSGAVKCCILLNWAVVRALTIRDHTLEGWEVPTEWSSRSRASSSGAVSSSADALGSASVAAFTSIVACTRSERLHIRTDAVPLSLFVQRMPFGLPESRAYVWKQQEWLDMLFATCCLRNQRVWWQCGGIRHQAHLRAVRRKQHAY